VRIHNFKFSLILFLLQSSCLMPAQSDVLTAAGANRNRAQAKQQTSSEWYNPTHVSLTVQAEDTTNTVAYEISSDQELKITTNAKGKHGQQETSEIMLVNGRCQWMLAKNAPLERGYEIDALDAPVLTLKLVTELLRAAVPGGPGGITKSTAVNVREKTKPIEVNTASASGGIEAPWTLQGTIEPTATGQWSFDLTVTHDQPMHITGTWQKETAAPVFGDDMSLAGWQVLSIGPSKRVEENATIYDYGAQPSRQQPKTLGELRKLATR
jgi:hypothetical protein